MSLKKFVVSALFAVLTLFIVVSFQKGPEGTRPEAQADSQLPGQALTRRPDAVKEAQSRSKATHPTTRTSGSKETPPSRGSFSYTEAQRNLQKLEAEYPNSKKQLMQIITSENFYQDQLSEPKPHSAEEWTQMQRGAIKVMALRALISKGQSQQEIQANLQNIIDSAKDLTIKNLAQAALKSSEEGRPFFKDLLNAIEDMPL